jgi:hypothetical protein
MSQGDVRATLMYAGQIAGRARFDTVEPHRTNLAFEPHAVDIRDARHCAPQPELDGAGFAFFKHRSAIATEPAFADANLGPQPLDPALNSQYLKETGEFLRQQLGARQVFAQLNGLLVRTATGSARKSWAQPANFVHLDYTAGSGPKFLDWSVAELNLELPAFRRFAVYQTWRAISPPPQGSALCVCDGRSVSRAECVVFDTVFGEASEPGRVFEARICRYEPGHQWYYLSGMQPDDLIVFKGFDSDVPDAANAMHTAFDHPAVGATGVPRVSVEARFFAVF